MAGPLNWSLDHGLSVDMTRKGQLGKVCRYVGLSSSSDGTSGTLRQPIWDRLILFKLLLTPSVYLTHNSGSDFM